MKMYILVSFVLLWTLATATICPGGQHKCNERSTCCKLTNDNYGCCPFPDAFCCSNGEYCCPSGYTCNETLGLCINKNSIINFSHLPSSNNNFHLCSNMKTVCPNDHLCCPATENIYKCCPQTDFCCTDGCCSPSFHKNTSKQYFLRNKQEKVLMSDASFILKTKSTLAKNICPDKHSSCPDGATCCQLPNDQWGCCPLPNATCCADRVHCCPNGMTCSETGSCKASLNSIPWLNTLKIRVASPHDSIVCPDKHFYCPNNNTCCLLPSGEWGCCDYSDAVCCSDHLHCCPNGMICDIPSLKCKSSTTTIPMNKKQKAKYINF